MRGGAKKYVGTDLAQVDHRRGGGFRAADTEAGAIGLRVGEDVIACPGDRQIGQHFLGLAEPFALRRAARHDDDVVEAQHHALGLAGGARGVEDDGDVGAAASGDLAGEEAGIEAGEVAPLLLHRRIGVQERIGVMAHAPRIVIEDRLEPGQALAHGDELVDLLLILGDDEAHLGMLEDEFHLGGSRVLVDRHRHAAEALRGGDRPVEPRPVVADDAELVAAPEAQRGEAVGEILHFARALGPTPALPDAEILLAHRRPAAAFFRMVEQQLGDGVGRGAPIRPRRRARLLLGLRHRHAGSLPELRAGLFARPQNLRGVAVFLTTVLRPAA